MTHRTTFALDSATAKRLKRLSSTWKISQVEVVRRAVARAEEETGAISPNPVAALQALHAAGQGLAPEKAHAYLRDVRNSRKRWRGV